MSTEYEITYISDPSLSESARTEADTAIDHEIAELKGTIVDNTAPTRNRLEYPIKKQNIGFTRLLNIQLEPDKIDTLRQTLKKRKEILRSTIIATAPRPAVTLEMLFKAPMNETKEATPEVKKSTKPVTEEAVEKGIEEALQEEVK